MNAFRPVALAAAVLAATALASAAQAQTFPDKSITFVVPFAAGTATDLAAKSGRTTMIWPPLPSAATGAKSFTGS